MEMFIIGESHSFR